MHTHNMKGLSAVCCARVEVMLSEAKRMADYCCSNFMHELNDIKTEKRIHDAHTLNLFTYNVWIIMLFFVVSQNAREWMNKEDDTIPPALHLILPAFADTMIRGILPTGGEIPNRENLLDMLQSCRFFVLVFMQLKALGAGRRQSVSVPHASTAER